jgi:hypothetical protein
MTKGVISFVSRCEVEFSFRRQASLETQRKEKEAEMEKAHVEELPHLFLTRSLLSSCVRKL